MEADALGDEPREGQAFHDAGQHKCEGGAEKSSADKRGKTSGDEAGGKRERPRGMKRRGEDGAEQAEARKQQRAASGQERKRQVDRPRQRDEPADKGAQSAEKQHEGRRGETSADNRPGDQHGHELQERAGHQQAQPADGDDMDERQRFRRAHIGEGIAVAGHHQPLPENEHEAGGGEVGHGPAGKCCARHVGSLAALVSVIRAAAAVAAAVFQPVDLDAPDFRPLLEIIPTELAGEIRLKLVVQRARVMVAGDQHRLAGRQRAKHAEDARMTLARGNDAHVDQGFVQGL